VLLQESVEGQALFAEPRDEAAQDGKAPQHLLDPLRSRIGPIRLRAATFSGLGSMPRWETMYPNSMSCGTPAGAAATGGEGKPTRGVGQVARAESVAIPRPALSGATGTKARSAPFAGGSAHRRSLIQAGPWDWGT
jgi:hypothetical protein